MNLTDIMESGAEISLTIKAQDLKSFAESLIIRTRIAIEAEIEEMKTDKLLTPESLCIMLQVDRSTLYRWDKSGDLISLNVGGKKRYRLSDVQSFIKQRNKTKDNL